MLNKRQMLLISIYDVEGDQQDGPVGKGRGWRLRGYQSSWGGERERGASESKLPPFKSVWSLIHLQANLSVIPTYVPNTCYTLLKKGGGGGVMQQHWVRGEKGQGGA